MITITCILLTWYLTKVYYTRSLTVKKTNYLEERGLAKCVCFKCAQETITKQENLRNPFYCFSCK